ncbi:MAG: hypothetical protein HRJ53_03000 [Acidobacteria bacterium Pan2503]|uniref:Ribbon-helix-helix protein CopG domain-containing protein n=1 Tax=Candidatus Acidiferrum panamense TaxID=2741543 RepID=A0A7V8SVJ7_9BACT|nr:hypothetical protein [Candidatus Acidoferrum panamensis]
MPKARNPYKQRVRDLHLVSVYCDQVMLRKLRREAAARRRKLGPTIAEILLEHFERKRTEAQVESGEVAAPVS